MISAKRFTNLGEESGTADLPDGLFSGKVNEHILWLTVRAHLAHQRQGNASVKTRAEVRGGGRKPWRQKGTGHARAGSIRSPIWVGGGRAFGPKPHKYRVRLPKKVKAIGFKSALTLAAKEDRVLVVGDLEIEVPKTSQLAGILDKIGVSGEKCLMVLGSNDNALYLSSRNIPYLRMATVDDLNTYDVLDCEKLILTESAVGKLEEVRSK